MPLGVLNRPGSLGPEAGKRSRGELPLLASGAGASGLPGTAPFADLPLDAGVASRRGGAARPLL